MRGVLAGAALVGLLTGPSAMAQAQKDAAPAAFIHQDRIFIQEAGLGGMAEVELGKLAQGKAQNAKVKEFAQHMMEEHGKANELLAGIGKEADAGLPKELDDEHRELKKYLEGLSGAAFDRAYIDTQVADHQKAASLAEWHIQNGDNAKLKSWAADNLPVILHHLDMATQMQAMLPMMTVSADAARAPAPRRATSGGGSAAPADTQKGETQDLNRGEIQKLQDGSGR
jgi:putative membrane protein